MKRLFTILIISIFIVPSVLSQKQNQEVHLYKYKIDKYSKIKNTGLGLGLSGAAFTTFGIVLMSNGEWVKQTSYGSVNYTAQDDKAAGGLILTALGIPLTITGKILGIIGAKTEKKYKNKLENVKLTGYVF